jgi:hypothetical protein
MEMHLKEAFNVYILLCVNNALKRKYCSTHPQPAMYMYFYTTN